MASKGEEKEMTMAEMEKHMKLARALAKRYPIFTLEQIVKFKQEFDEFDLDGSGDIDKYEVMQMFEKFGEKVPKKAAVAMIALYDKDGEGTISFDEFVKMMYDLQMGTVDATNGFLRMYILERASLEAMVDMARTSSSNLTDLSLHKKLARGGDWRLHDALKTNTALTRLAITSCGLTAWHANEIATAMLDNSSLHVLDLGGNAIEDQGFHAVAGALRMPPDTQEAWAALVDCSDEMADLRRDFREVNRVFNNYLEQLQDQNGILQQPGNPHFIYDDPRARRKFEQARARNEELLRELEHWGMREMQAQEYYESLKGNQYLRELHCRDCYLYDSSGLEAAEMLSCNTVLTVLNLEGNSISGSGAVAIAEALRHHVALRHLNLSGNVCGSEAGTAFAEMLRTNSSLTRLELAHCSFSNQGVAHFDGALRTNRTLEALDLSGNLITEPLALQLVSTLTELREETPLTQLVMLHNDIDPPCQLTIQQLLGGEWKCKNSVAGIGLRKRHQPRTDEAVAALSKKQLAAIESAFNFFDEDGSGDVDADELFKAVEMLEIEISKEEVEDMIRAVDADGSGTIDLEEFTGIMAVMFVMNKQEQGEDSDDEAVDLRSGDEIVAELMFASGLYDPCHVFPEAMKWDGAKQLASMPALRTGYRIIGQMEGNASLSDKHVTVVKRVMRHLGWDRKAIKKQCPVTARQLYKALGGFKDIVAAPEGDASDASQVGSGALEARLASVEVPEEDQARLDQAMLWLFRGVPLRLEGDEADDD